MSNLDKCPICKGTGTAEGQPGFTLSGPCPECKPDRWGPYVRHGEWYRLADTQVKCPRCGGVEIRKRDGWSVYDCGSVDDLNHTNLCLERTAHAETRKREDALKLQFDQAVAQRDFWEKRCDEKDAEIKREREKWEKLKKWANEFYHHDLRVLVFVEMNRLDAEAKETTKPEAGK